MKYISLFSGGMGLDLGLSKAGFQTAVCVENNKEAVTTIRHNCPNVAVFDTSIEAVTGEAAVESGNFEGEVDLIAGGPPCQSFSVFGNRLGIKDARGQLIFEFSRLVSEVRPKTFLMENVRGLLSMSIVPNTPENQQDEGIPSEYLEKGSLMRLIFSEFNKIGYNVNCFVVNSVNYGAPQIRERILLIGNRFGYDVAFPVPRFSNRVQDNLPPFRTLGDAIGPDSGFVDNCPEVLNFSPRKLKYLAMVPAGGNWRSLPVEIQKESMKKSWYLKGGRSAYWRKLSFGYPSPTVVTMPNHAGTSMCHPSELRAISVGEAAAIQEFPDTWEFQGSTAAKFRQIGNAVPIRLGEIAGNAIRDLLSQIDETGVSDSPCCSGTIVHHRPHVRTRTFWKNGKAFAGDTDYYDKSV
jgi:DNA (cytosine-5)-methyltransferase 1